VSEAKKDQLEVVFALEGERKPQSLHLPADATVADLLKEVTKRAERGDLSEVIIEDEDQPLAPDKPLADALDGDFKVVHVSTPGRISVTVTCNGKQATEAFSPSTTLQKIIVWAISPEALQLEGDATDFQLKQGEEVLAPDHHLGQIAQGAKELALTLVFKVKPQG
jgi:sulfur carrier protein ThiS